MSPQEIQNMSTDAAIRQAEIIRSAYIAGACKSMVRRIRTQLADRQAARHGLPGHH